VPLRRSPAPPAGCVSAQVFPPGSLRPSLPTLLALPLPLPSPLPTPLTLHEGRLPTTSSLADPPSSTRGPIFRLIERIWSPRSTTLRLRTLLRCAPSKGRPGNCLLLRGGCFTRSRRAPGAVGAS
jgi:hypothetical protein